jgi:CRP-like cAMP-binding protein
MSASPTPRTDAAERFFYEPGRSPVGFVDSGLARVLEFELNRALEQIRQLGAELPPPLDESTQAQLRSLQRPKRNVLGQIASNAATAAAPPASAQAQLLGAAIADATLGSAGQYADGQVMFRRGERAEHLFLVIDGQVAVSQRQDQGPDCTLGPGSVFGAHALFEASLHHMTVLAKGPVSVVLLDAGPWRERLAADTGILPVLLMALSLQQQLVTQLAWQQAAGALAPAYAVLGERTYTGPELQRVLLDDKARLPGERMGAEQTMALHLQASDHLPVRAFRSGQSLGAPGQDHPGAAVMVISGKARASWGGLSVELGQGAVIGLAEGLTGMPFEWEYTAIEDLNTRVLPIERCLQQLERADGVLRNLASHACAAIMMRQSQARAAAAA